MIMNFDVSGPFYLSRHGKKKMITEQSMADLRPQLESEESGLSKACGCYVFAIHAGRGYTPYYVGQACKQSVLREALNPSNREKYNKACSESEGKPVLFLLPMRSPNGRYRKKGGGGLAIDFLERWLIAAALKKNPNLTNNRETKILRKIKVAGIFNQERGRVPTASQHLAKTLGLS
jgi:hypothetical protein